jgi:hypothetical protein
MVLTGHELTAASSAVAFLAIVSGYFGIRSANRNALNIAREERSTRRRDELNDLRRVTYAKFLVSLDALALASVEQEALLILQLLFHFECSRDACSVTAWHADDVTVRSRFSASAGYTCVT